MRLMARQSARAFRLMRRRPRRQIALLSKEHAVKSDRLPLTVSGSYSFPSRHPPSPPPTLRPLPPPPLPPQAPNPLAIVVLINHSTTIYFIARSSPPQRHDDHASRATPAVCSSRRTSWQRPLGSSQRHQQHRIRIDDGTSTSCASFS
jgi:hypothetical protein